MQRRGIARTWRCRSSLPTPPTHPSVSCIVRHAAGLREPVFVTENSLKRRQLLSSGSAADTGVGLLVMCSALVPLQVCARWCPAHTFPLPAAITVEAPPASETHQHPRLASAVDLDKEGSSKEAQASMVLPFTPLAMAFRDVQYSVPFGGVGGGARVRVTNGKELRSAG